jgi:hypothetical protein
MRHLCRQSEDAALLGSILLKLQRKEKTEHLLLEVRRM